jgi:tetratricopeptide (TPR) repeat protein
MKCKKTAITVATILLITFQAFCQSAEQLAAQAAKESNSMHFGEAIKLYEKIVDNGFESPSLYYNLGNAYFRNNENAEAILYYEKALKLAPNNADIKHNIEIVNNRLVDKVEKVPELFYKRWWKYLVNIMSVDAFATFNISLLTLALLLFALYIAIPALLLRKISFWSGLGLLFIFSIGLVAASQRNHYLENNHEAIVFEPTVNIKSSPDENSKDIFVLHEGTKVTLLDEVAEWQEIRISNGSIGWIKASDLRKI